MVLRTVAEVHEHSLFPFLLPRVTQTPDPVVDPPESATGSGGDGKPLAHAKDAVEEWDERSNRYILTLSPNCSYNS